jgi:phosphoserine phosphatase
MRGDTWAAYKAWTTTRPMQAYGWLPTLLAGYQVDEVARMAAGWYASCYRHYLFPEMMELLAVLKDAGAKSYIVSASAQPILHAAQPYTGIPAERIFGIRLRRSGDVYLPEIEQPASYASGKVWYIEHFVRPGSLDRLLTFGDSYVSDGPMLRLANRHGGVGVLINPSAALMPRVERDGLLHQTFRSVLLK